MFSLHHAYIAFSHKKRLGIPISKAKGILVVVGVGILTCNTKPQLLDLSKKKKEKTKGMIGWPINMYYNGTVWH